MDDAERAGVLAMLMLERAVGEDGRVAPGDARAEALLESAVRQLEHARRELEHSVEHRQLRVQVVKSLADALTARPWRLSSSDAGVALGLLEDLLQDPTLRELPRLHGNVLHNLAVLYQNRTEGGAAENLERAIDHLGRALELEESDAVARATTLSQLGNAYHLRLRGDRDDNLERALTYYQQALAVRTRASDPVRWGITQHNLGVAYRERRTGDRTANLRASAEALHAALSVRPREARAEYWAMTVRELGIAYAELGGPDDLDTATRLLEGAAEVYTREDAALEWCGIQLALAGLARARGADDDAERILDPVLRLDDLRRERPLLWARVVATAGPVRARRAAAAGDGTLLADALDLLHDGASTLLEHGDLTGGRHLATILGDHLLALGVHEGAAAAYRAAVEADADQYRASLSLESRARQVGRSEGVAARAALALVRSGQPRRAVEMLERGRARLIGDALARDRADLRALRRGDAAGRSAAERFDAAAREIRALERAERLSAGLSSGFLPEA